jgi:hypothetical protein
MCFQDQSIIKQWTVVVKTATGNGTIIKRAVCYEGGSIKVFCRKKEERLF